MKMNMLPDVTGGFTVVGGLDQAHSLLCNDPF